MKASDYYGLGAAFADGRNDDVVRSDDQARAAIEDAGYSGVRSMTHSSSIWRANATAEDGSVVAVMVNAIDGSVTQANK